MSINAYIHSLARILPSCQLRNIRCKLSGAQYLLCPRRICRWKMEITKFAFSTMYMESKELANILVCVLKALRIGNLSKRTI